jgi:hypothetical protein
MTKEIPSERSAISARNVFEGVAEDSGLKRAVKDRRCGQRVTTTGRELVLARNRRRH